MRKQSSLLSVLGVTSMQEMLLALTSLQDLSDAMRKAGLQSTNLIFGKTLKRMFLLFVRIAFQLVYFITVPYSAFSDKLLIRYRLHG